MFVALVTIVVGIVVILLWVLWGIATAIYTGIKNAVTSVRDGFMDNSF